MAPTPRAAVARPREWTPRGQHACAARSSVAGDAAAALGCTFGFGAPPRSCLPLLLTPPLLQPAAEAEHGRVPRRGHRVRHPQHPDGDDLQEWAEAGHRHRGGAQEHPRLHHRQVPVRGRGRRRVAAEPAAASIAVLLGARGPMHGTGWTALTRVSECVPTATGEWHLNSNTPTSRMPRCRPRSPSAVPNGADHRPRLRPASCARLRPRCCGEAAVRVVAVHARHSVRAQGPALRARMLLAAARISCYRLTA